MSHEAGLQVYLLDNELSKHAGPIWTVVSKSVFQQNQMLGMFHVSS